MFRRGLPEQFSFVSTIMMSGTTRKAIWNLIKIVDPNGDPQMGIRLNGKLKTVDFYYKNLNNEVSTLTFTKIKKVSSIFTLRNNTIMKLKNFLGAGWK